MNLLRTVLRNPLASRFQGVLPVAAIGGVLLFAWSGRNTAAEPMAEEKPASVAVTETVRADAPQDIRQELALMRSRLVDEPVREGAEAVVAAVPLVAAAQVVAAQDVAAGGEADGVAAEGEVLDAVEAQVANIEQQFAAQFRNIMKSELYFARKICGLDAIQFKAISAVGEQAQREATKKFADVQRRMMRGQLRPDEGSPYPDPRSIIAKVIADSLEMQVSESQNRLYQLELERRTTFRKRVAVRNLVFRLDNQLVLSDEQRTSIQNDLLKHWQEGWGNQLEYLIYDQFNAQLPDEPIVPHLNEAQKQVWTLSKSNSRTMFGWGGFGGPMIENLWDVQLEAAAVIVEVPVAPLVLPAAPVEPVEKQP